MGVLGLAGYKRRKSALTAGLISPLLVKKRERKHMPVTRYELHVKQHGVFAVHVLSETDCDKVISSFIL